MSTWPSTWSDIWVRLKVITVTVWLLLTWLNHYLIFPTSISQITPTLTWFTWSRRVLALTAMRQNLEILSPFMHSTSGLPDHLLSCDLHTADYDYDYEGGPLTNVNIESDWYGCMCCWVPSFSHLNLKSWYLFQVGENQCCEVSLSQLKLHNNSQHSLFRPEITHRMQRHRFPRPYQRLPLMHRCSLSLSVQGHAWIPNSFDLEIIGVTVHFNWVFPRVVIFNWSNLKSDRNERIFHQTSHFHDGHR